MKTKNLVVGVLTVALLLGMGAGTVRAQDPDVSGGDSQLAIMISAELFSLTQEALGLATDEAGSVAAFDAFVAAFLIEAFLDLYQGQFDDGQLNTNVNIVGQAYLSFGNAQGATVALVAIAQQLIALGNPLGGQIAGGAALIEQLLANAVANND